MDLGARLDSIGFYGGPYATRALAAIAAVVDDDSAWS